MGRRPAGRRLGIEISEKLGPNHNLAVLKQLPVLFICENNLYSVYSPLGVRQPEGRAIHQMVGAMGLPCSCHDGNDALAVHRTVEDGVRAIRAGGGPRFYEFMTYRWREHCGPFYDNDIGYRTEAEFESWKAREPIARLEQTLRCDGALTPADAAAIDREIEHEVEEAFRFAENSPDPAPQTAFAHVYASQPG